jgi:repressor LexA
MTSLTPRQNEVLKLIRTLTRVYGYPPTVRELAQELGISSPNGVSVHLRALENKGAIVRDANVARSIRIVEVKTCPHCGRDIA